MESNQNQHLELWTQFLAGNELSPTERHVLLGALRNNPEFRKIAMRDQEMNWLLTELQKEERTEEDFVQGVMDRCQNDDVTATEANHVAIHDANTKETSSKVARSSRFAVEPPPVCRQPVASAAEEREQSVKVNGHEKPAAVTTVRKRRKSVSHQMIALACALLFVLGIGALALVDFAGEDSANANDGKSNPDVARDEAVEKDDSDTSQGPTEPDRQAPSSNVEPVFAQFATLTAAEDAIWNQAPNIGDRIGNEELQLISGQAELTLDDGALVHLSAPASFRLVSPAEVNLAQGNLSAVVPPQAIGFRVITPTSNIVDLGTEFDVEVENSGATDVLVRRGEIAVTANDDAGQPEEMRLVADGLNQATVFERVVDRPESPVASAARGVGGQFHGTISVNGKSMQFDDPEAFENVRQRVFTGFRNTPSDVMKEWADFVESFQRQAGMQGSVTLNGVQVGFGSMEEAMRLHEKMQEAMRQMGGSGSSASSSSSSQSFQGTLTINGKVMTFTSREEYEAAKRKLFGPAATFGAGRVDKN